MEEEKAAEYYDELTRKGSGAARFKQGLGFSSAATATDEPSRGSALPSSSFMSNFVKASTPKTAESEVDKKAQLQSIQNKLKKKGPTSTSAIDDADVPSDKIRVRDKDRDRRRRSRSRERERDSDSRRRRSDDERDRDRQRDSDSRRKRSDDERDRERSRRRHRGSSRERRRRSRSRSRSRRGRSRSYSPRDRRRSERGRESGGGGGGGRDKRTGGKEGNAVIDYATLIHGYDKMTPAERVKAKMKLQLSQTAEKDTNMGSGSQWERFDFNKDAPVDDKEIEAADDDASLVKHIGQSFRFTSLEAKRENQIENAHDEAIFGVPVPNFTSDSGEEGESEPEKDDIGSKDDAAASSLINEKVLWKQQGSWRDRARKNVG